jgi:ABC-type dipeptide/oligopeptide/nickel transport system permease subunit
MAGLLGLPNYALFILITVLLGALIGGLSGWSGGWMNKAFRK